MSNALRRRLEYFAEQRSPGLLRRLQPPNDRAREAVDSSDTSLAYYDRLLSDEAAACAVPADLLRAICWYASGWRQYAPNGSVLHTPAAQGSSWGCMQLNDHWHPDAFPAAMSDASASIRYAANLLSWLHEQTGSWDRATVAFFGHDRRAELAARRVRKYRDARPWLERLLTTTEPDLDCADAAELDDLYAELG